MKNETKNKIKNRIKISIKALGYIVPQMLFLSTILWFINVNMIIIVIVASILLIATICRYKIMYAAINEVINDISVISAISNKDNDISELKKSINNLECSEKMISKRHDFYKSLSPVGLFGIIFTLLAKIYPNYSNGSANSILSKIWNRISTLHITNNTFGDTCIIILAFALIWCLVVTVDTMYKYNNIVFAIQLYKDALTNAEAKKQNNAVKS